MPMTPEAFRAWRRTRRLSQVELAERLGVSRRWIQAVESGAPGKRKPQETMVPRFFELALAALSVGIEEYDGRQVAVQVRDSLISVQVASPSTG